VCIECIKKALQDAKLRKEDIQEVVLVGGSTRVPKVQEMISQFFDSKKLNMSVNPDEAMACGAAIQAAILNNDQHSEVKDLLLIDVNPLSLGNVQAGDTTFVIIERNTPLPVCKTVISGTAFDDQTKLSVQVLEGERCMAKDNNSLGFFILKGIPPAPMGKEKIHITYELDADGVLKVSAVHDGTGKQKSMTIDSKTSGRMTTQDINDLIEKADKMKILDEKEELRHISRNKLRALCINIHIEAQTLPSRGVRGLIGRVEKCTQ